MVSLQTKVVVWSNRILWLIAFIITFYILKKEVLKRRHNTNNSNNQPKYLKIWSIIVLISGPIQCLLHLFGSIPYLCYINPLSQALLYFNIIGLGCFKLAKLHYCFSKSQTHASQYAYSNIVFIIMFTVAFLITFIALILPWMTQTVHVLLHYFSCIIYWHTNAWQGFVLLTIRLLSFIWDWMIIFLYGCKIYSFKKIISNKHDPSVYNRVVLVLQKMVFLCLCYSIIESLLGLIVNIVDIHTFHGGLLMVIFPVFAKIMYCYIQFIMIEHNCNEYKQFLKFMYKSKIIFVGYCCCSTLIRNIKTGDDVNNLADTVQANSQESNIENTQTTDTKIDRIQLEMKHEFTVTQKI